MKRGRRIREKRRRKNRIYRGKMKTSERHFNYCKLYFFEEENKRKKKIKREQNISRKNGNT